ncbi:MAG: START-like domain-containing protein [Bacteroidales bacterium]
MKSKVKLEYLFPSVSASRLWDLVGTPIGLSDWFCDTCEVEDSIYHFEWQRNIERASCLRRSNGNVIRFKWEGDDSPVSYFEFKVLKNDLTTDVVLEITDFASMNEEDECVELWNTQVDVLKRVLGV